nr:heme-binding protein 2-like [Penaeus vannamei]
MFRNCSNIDGQNDAAMKIDMTAPVTTLVIPGEGPNCENNFTMSFYVPAAHQDNPPTPTNPDVYIEERPELHVFSRRFHGFANDEDWIVNAAQLHDDLVAAGEEGVDFQTYYTAGYDSPYVIIGRNNEVWFMK